MRYNSGNRASSSFSKPLQHGTLLNKHSWKDGSKEVKNLLGILLFISFSVTLAQEPVQLTPTSVVHFATPEEGATLLGSSDDFTTAMSPLDRALRVGKNDVTEEELLEYLSAQSVAWTDEEVTRLSGFIAQIAKGLEGLTFTLPEEVLLIKTTGQDEFDAPYTRQNAIILPESFLAAPDDAIFPTLAHELFHILSRANPDKKDDLYGVIGFTPCKAFTFPESLAAIKITNPDAPLTQHSIEVTANSEEVQVLPVLFIEDDIDPTQRKPLGQLFGEGTIQFKLLAIDANCQAVMKGDTLALYDVAEVTGFFDKTGKNTEYIIHPEEILADNFSLLLGEADVPNPEITTGLAKILGLQ
jgi:hypothetical protein